jgi:hypothetical protein
MKIAKTVLALLVGLVCGVVLVMSCGDQTSPARVDAAPQQCDCPAAEPPLAGRIVRVTSDRSIPAMELNAVVAICESGTILISGGCFARSTDPKYVLHSAYPGPDGATDPRAWICEFYNGTAAPVTSTAYATCLKPAP